MKVPRGSRHLFKLPKSVCTQINLNGVRVNISDRVADFNENLWPNVLWNKAFG
jgi:hypothetical protein